MRLNEWPVCWRCQEKIHEYYALTGKMQLTRWPMPSRAGLPVTFLCAECTDEMAELNRP